MQKFELLHCHAIVQMHVTFPTAQHKQGSHALDMVEGGGVDGASSPWASGGCPCPSPSYFLRDYTPLAEELPNLVTDELPSTPTNWPWHDTPPPLSQDYSLSPLVEGQPPQLDKGQYLWH